ncbi:MAG: glycosyltransferase [Myxococcota bacterium]
MTPATPRLSVLLPYRNAAPTLDEALRSVLSEREVPLEVLAVDDGSQDDGPERVRARARDDPRVRPLTTQGVGIARALNLAVEGARAPLLARMDADDVSLPGRFPRQVAMLEGDPSLGAVGTRVEAFPAGAVGGGLARYVRWQNGLVTPADHDRDLFVESPLCHPSVAIRRRAMDAVGGYHEGPFPEDYDLWLRLHAAGWRLAKVPQVLLRWRHESGRMTFQDPRFAPERFRELKARHLAPRLHAIGRPVTLWGAGPTGRRLGRALEAHGIRAQRFVDIDPRKIGGHARGVPIVAPERLRKGTELILVAVGARGARKLIRNALDARGFVELEDYICAA